MFAIQQSQLKNMKRTRLPVKPFYHSTKDAPLNTVSRLRLTTQMKFFDGQMKGVQQDTGLSQILNERRRQEDQPVGILFVTMNNES